jgi:hypothetical protein
MSHKLSWVAGHDSNQGSGQTRGHWTGSDVSANATGASNQSVSASVDAARQPAGPVSQTSPTNEQCRDRRKT